MIQRRLTPEEIAQRGEELYERSIRQLVEAEHCGKYLVLDVVSGEYEIDADHMAASDRAAAKHPRGMLYAMRIGERALGRIGYRTSAGDTR